MTTAVFDSSAVLAIVFDEPGSERGLELLDGGVISAVNHSEALTKMIEKGFLASEALDGLAATDTDGVPDPTDLDWYHGPDDWQLADLPDSLRNFVQTTEGGLLKR